MAPRRYVRAGADEEGIRPSETHEAGKWRCGGRACHSSSVCILPHLPVSSGAGRGFPASASNATAPRTMTPPPISVTVIAWPRNIQGQMGPSTLSVNVSRLTSAAGT